MNPSRVKSECLFTLSENSFFQGVSTMLIFSLYFSDLLCPANYRHHVSIFCRRFSARIHRSESRLPKCDNIPGSHRMARKKCQAWRTTRKLSSARSQTRIWIGRLTRLPASCMFCAASPFLDARMFANEVIPFQHPGSSHLQVQEGWLSRVIRWQHVRSDTSIYISYLSSSQVNLGV